MSHEAMIPLEGHCLCGRVHLRVVPEALHADACHCGMCRRWGGGPVLSIPCGDRVTVVQGEDDVTAFDSSEWAQRCFCRHCGSHLFYRLREAGTCFVSAGLFGDIEGLAFTTEIFIDHKPDWYAFANPTRKMTEAEVMAAFGAG
ncbi:MAG TPA: GFA family protein [Luteimonas sp.]|nr:GFA family protein [Luteimonas sp.]HRO27173.1 GFA family protein [Luteimonas sp.]HRP73402.1 GFA family protein [Luteimonas sp.]